MAAAPSVAALALSAPLWIAVLFPRYPGAADVFIPVGLTVIVFFASSQTTAFLNASHRDRLAALSAIVGLIAAAIGSLGLVALGAFGVALGRLVGEGTRLAIESLAVVRVARPMLPGMARTWLVVAPAVAAIVAPLVLGWTLPVVIVGAVVVAALAAVAVRTGLRTVTAP